MNSMKADLMRVIIHPKDTLSTASLQQSFQWYKYTRKSQSEQRTGEARTSHLSNYYGTMVAVVTFHLMAFIKIIQLVSVWNNHQIALS